jgi:hypothetical protein
MGRHRRKGWIGTGRRRSGGSWRFRRRNPREEERAQGDGCSLLESVPYFVSIMCRRLITPRRNEVYRRLVVFAGEAELCMSFRCVIHTTELPMLSK